MERLLYRLSRSKHSTSFVLKGGLMLRVWKAPVTRPTKDVDLLGHTKNTVANLVSIVQAVCAESVEPDGMQFDSATVAGSPINEDAEYNGIRVKFIGRLGVARASMKGAVEVLSRYLAKELAGRGIVVNTIAPGATATDFGGGAVRDNPQLQSMLSSVTALGHVGQADDIGPVVASLLTDDVRCITGQRIEASGGMFL